MTVFALIGALLIGGALLFILPPLLRRSSRDGVSRAAVNVSVYRDQLRELDADLRAGTLAVDQYDRARRELEARLLEDVTPAAAPAPASRRAGRAALAVGLGIPLCAAAVYFMVGTPGALAPGPAGPRDPAHSLSQQQIEALVERLAARLRDSPEDTEGWIMMARSYTVLGRFGEASRAYAHATARLPTDAQLLADYADTLAMAQGRRLQGEPEKIIARALTADPRNLKALALAGSAAFESGDYAAAIDHWERLLRIVPAESDLARSVRASIADARAPRGPSGPAGTASSVSGVVKLAPELAARVAPTDTVFIFARAADGPRMPLAVVRRKAGDLPAKFSLDDTLAMTPEARLSNFQRIVVAARISKSASGTPQAGDLQGLSAPVANTASGITVVIDAVIQ